MVLYLFMFNSTILNYPKVFLSILANFWQLSRTIRQCKPRYYGEKLSKVGHFLGIFPFWSTFEMLKFMTCSIFYWHFYLSKCSQKLYIYSYTCLEHFYKFWERLDNKNMVFSTKYVVRTKLGRLGVFWKFLVLNMDQTCHCPIKI